LCYDFGNIHDYREKTITKDDLYGMPWFILLSNSDEWKQFERENPDQVASAIQDFVDELNNRDELKDVPWLYPMTEEYNCNYEIEEVRILDPIAPSSTAFWFQGLFNLQMIKGVENLDTSNVTDMRKMFNYCGLKTVDLSSFSTSNVTNMRCMFSHSDFTSLDLGSFDTSKVNDMFQMFSYSPDLTNINLESFDTSNVTIMYGMFYGCSSLKSLDLRSFRTSSVKNMGIMFANCPSLRTLDLRSFDISGLTETSLGETGGKMMFANCGNLTEIKVSQGWNPISDDVLSAAFIECGVTGVTYYDNIMD